MGDNYGDSCTINTANAHSHTHAGMSDHLSIPLGNHGYKTYKYVPYGKVNEVMPYLLRRAQENSDAFGGAKHEMQLISKELKRRIFSR